MPAPGHVGAAAITWGVLAHKSVRLLLPTGTVTSTLRAHSMDRLGPRTPRPAILVVLAAVQNRHCRAGLRKPMCGPNRFSAPGPRPRPRIPPGGT